MKRWFLVMLIMISALVLAAQSKPIKIDAYKQPLNRVLVQLRDAYNFQFSFNDDLLSRYRISLKGTFLTKDEVMDKLIEGLPLEIIKSDEVYLIVPKKELESDSSPKSLWTLKGRIVEAGTFEPLPFSHILINNRTLVSDIAGSFTYTASSDSTFKVRVSHLGYFIFDTLVTAGINQQFGLYPANAALPEITVEHSTIEKSAIMGENPGTIQLNHYISKFLPGQGDNSVFNLLRLMPGILAAGEQSSDLLIWGGFEGQSQVTFDGFTLFGLKNFNDNISVVNPFMVKNIDVLKGGFSARYGDRVGAMVNISGKNGNIARPSFTINLSTTTLNSLVELPLFKKSSLLLAYRQTYYNLYRNSNLDIFSPIPVANNRATDQKPDKKFDMQLSPESYVFRDFNLKYSWNFDHGGLFYISIYSGQDHFSLSGETQTEATPGKKPKQFTIKNESSENYRQQGASVFYTHPFRNGNNSSLIASYSFYHKSDSSSIESENTGDLFRRTDEKMNSENHLLEFSLRNENKIRLSKRSELNIGLGTYFNEVVYTRDLMLGGLANTYRSDTSDHYRLNWFYAYAIDEFSLGTQFKGNIGLRMIFTPNRGRFFPEPRLSVKWSPNERFSVQASAGRYHQFVFKRIHIDRNTNYSSYWTGSEDNPLSALHFTSGVSFKKNQFMLNIESFYKPVNGIIRTESKSEDQKLTIWRGDARSYGIDIFARQDFGPHAIWLSYTLSKSLERLSDSKTLVTQYSPSPQDQRHELKAAALVKVGKFHFASNYVFGSGVELLKKIAEEQGMASTYSRWDASVTYRFHIKKLTGEAGASVLNILNRQNVRYPNLKKVEIKDYGNFSVYTQSVPFTPTLFLQFKF